MAHGKAVVAGATGGLLGLVRDGETGLLVEPGNPKELRAAIDRLLADPALRKRLGENARAWITELCSWDKVIAETIETYEQALGQARRDPPSIVGWIVKSGNAISPRPVLGLRVGWCARAATARSSTASTSGTYT